MNLEAELNEPEMTGRTHGGFPRPALRSAPRHHRKDVIEQMSNTLRVALLERKIDVEAASILACGLQFLEEMEDDTTES